jgi:hypothetical protein
MKKTGLCSLLLNCLWKSSLSDNFVTDDIDSIMLLHSQNYWPYIPYNFHTPSFDPVLSYTQYLIPNKVDIVISSVAIQSSNITEFPVIDELSFPIVFSREIFVYLKSHALVDKNLLLLNILAMSASTFQVMDITHAKMNWKRYYSICYMRPYRTSDCKNLAGKILLLLSVSSCNEVFVYR